MWLAKSLHHPSFQILFKNKWGKLANPGSPEKSVCVHQKDDQIELVYSGQTAKVGSYNLNKSYAIKYREAETTVKQDKLYSGMFTVATMSEIFPNNNPKLLLCASNQSLIFPRQNKTITASRFI